MTCNYDAVTLRLPAKEWSTVQSLHCSNNENSLKFLFLKYGIVCKYIGEIGAT